MKINEAPEKIYLFENPITETPDDRWLSKRSDENDIEYTRTDAFIEKAKNWLYLQLNEINMEGEDMANFLKDFKKYMED